MAIDLVALAERQRRGRFSAPWYPHRLIGAAITAMCGALLLARRPYAAVAVLVTGGALALWRAEVARHEVAALNRHFAVVAAVEDVLTDVPDLSRALNLAAAQIVGSYADACAVAVPGLPPVVAARTPADLDPVLTGAGESTAGARDGQGAEHRPSPVRGDRVVREPIRAYGGRLGTLTVARLDGRRFDEADHALAKALASRVGQAIVTGRLREQAVPVRQTG